MEEVKSLIYNLMAKVSESSEAETKLNVLVDWLADKAIKDRAVFKDDIEEILNAIGYEVLSENSEQD